MIGYKCYHTLSIDWGPRLLRHNKSLVEKQQRQRHDSVVDRCPLIRRCPVDGCNLVVLTATALDVKLASSSPSSTSLVASPAANDSTKSKGSTHTHRSVTASPLQTLSKMIFCSAGHAICLSCNNEGHAPLSCAIHTYFLPF